MRYVALLRGVNNIGAARRVAMADVRALFEGMGFRSVRTLLNSGNVVFSAQGLEVTRGDVRARIEKGFSGRLGMPVPVILLTVREVAAVVRENPMAGVAGNPSHLLVCVPRHAADLIRLKPLLQQTWSPEALALGRRVAYLWCANGVPRSPVWRTVDRALARTGTVRNMATFTRIVAASQGLAPMRACHGPPAADGPGPRG